MFAAAYPGKHFGSCTIAVFEAMLNAARRTHHYLNGNYNNDLSRIDSVNQGNRLIIVQRRYPSFFPETELEGG